MIALTQSNDFWGCVADTEPCSVLAVCDSVSGEFILGDCRLDGRITQAYQDYFGHAPSEHRPGQKAINDICTHDQTRRMLLGRTYDIRTLPKQYRIKRLALYLRYGLVPDQEAINKASIAGHQAILNVLHQHGIYPSTMGMLKLRLQQDLRATSRGQIFALVILSLILTILVLVL